MFFRYSLFIKQLLKKTITINILLLSFIPSLSFAGESEAFEHLYEVMDKYHNSFDVYTDQDEGGNHFYPSGWMGDIASISFDSDWTSNCYAGTSCIKIAFTAKTDNWAGIYWQEPENNWGTVSNGGYDISGATKLTFWAKGEKGDERIEFFAGGIKGDNPDTLSKTSTGKITLTNSWQEYTIGLNSKDLSHVIGGFGWVANSSDNPGGATFYLDDIKYDKPRPDELRFLVSFETISLDSPDKYLNNACFVYDNALALLAFLARGNTEDLRRAKILADALVSAQNNDRYYTDGRLRDAYMSGDLIDNSTNKARLPGYTSGGKWEEDVNQVSTHTGNMAWAIIALVSYYEKAGGSEYLDTAKTLGEWINNETKDTGESGGYTGGYEGSDTASLKVTWKSTEHNLDVYGAFMLLYEATGDKKWKDGALHAKNFVAVMWYDDENHFWTGTLDDGTTNYYNIPVDIHAEAIMSIGNYSSALSWAESNCYTEADGFKGFDFNFDNDGVWFEGTAQIAIAYQINGETSKSNIYIDELREAQNSATNANGKGIVAASHDGVTTGFLTENYGDLLPWELYSRLNVAATAWYIFAEKKLNPYWIIITPDIKANGSDVPITLGPDDKLSITVALDSGGNSGTPADWWILASTPPSGFIYLTTSGWAFAASFSDIVVTLQIPLVDFPSVEILKIPAASLPSGTYTFYFAIDKTVDGVLNSVWLAFDSVTVVKP